MDPAKIQILEDRLEYTFNEKKELLRALTHPSFSKEVSERKDNPRDCPHQEIYATLGDAVLKAGLVLILMDIGLKTKGNITISKVDIENNFHLADVGKRLHLLEENFILHRVGKDEKLKEGSVTLCSDTVEAIIGAVFIDSENSMSAVKKTISKIFANEISNIEKKFCH